MKSKLILALVLAALSFTAWQHASAASRVGYVTRIEGNARSFDEGGRVAELQANSPVFESDRIETDPESRLHIRMDDGAEVQMKGDSVLKITEYVITEGYDAGSSSVLDLLRGGLRKITGAIGASSDANYRMDTGVAAIGIRGTDYVIKLCKLDDCTQTASRNDPNAKLHAAVLDGAITLSTEEEVQLLMAKGEYGTATYETLVVQEGAVVPEGFLNSEESRQFGASTPQQASTEEQQVPDTWKWILGILLVVVAL